MRIACGPDRITVFVSLGETVLIETHGMHCEKLKRRDARARQERRARRMSPVMAKTWNNNDAGTYPLHVRLGPQQRSPNQSTLFPFDSAYNICVSFVCGIQNAPYRLVSRQPTIQIHNTLVKYLDRTSSATFSLHVTRCGIGRPNQIDE